MLLLGVHARVTALALIPILLGATWAHSGNGWVFSAPNGGWEFPLFLVAAALTLGLLSDGKFAIKASPVAVA